jgi:tetratricopeptide (TPR) repeat protein
MGRLVGRALEQRQCAEAQALLQPLDDYWDARGLTQEARGWVDRCRKTIEGADGAPPDFASAAGALWLFMVVSEANRSLNAGALDSAEAAYQLIRRNLEQSAAGSQNRLLAVAYHQLGMVAQQRGALEQAEQWYRIALEIKEALKNQPGLARSYHQLGIVAYLRGELEQVEQWCHKALEIKEALQDQPGLASSYCLMGLLAEAKHDENLALDWMVRCVALFDQFPHPATGPGPKHLARLTAKLGMSALQSSWQRQTGKTLPPQVQAAVEQMIEESRKEQNE